MRQDQNLRQRRIAARQQRAHRRRQRWLKLHRRRQTHAVDPSHAPTPRIEVGHRHGRGHAVAADPFRIDAIALGPREGQPLVDMDDRIGSGRDESPMITRAGRQGTEDYGHPAAQRARREPRRLLGHLQPDELPLPGRAAGSTRENARLGGTPAPALVRREIDARRAVTQARKVQHLHRIQFGRRETTGDERRGTTLFRRTGAALADVAAQHLPITPQTAAINGRGRRRGGRTGHAG